MGAGERADGTHLDALWETVDLAAGDAFALNPLEAYVLGGAILLHDLGLSVSFGLPGLIQAQRLDRLTEDWPRGPASRYTPSMEGSLEECVWRAIAAAWSIPMSELTSNSVIADDEFPVYAVVGSRKGMPLKESVSAVVDRAVPG